jgi:hypothetical protein
MARNSSNDGTRTPAKAGEYQDPASSVRSWEKVRSTTAPEPSVVRSTVSSWMSTGTPSAVSCRSVSTKSSELSRAPCSAGMVFSGAIERSPRCPAMSAACPGLRSAPNTLSACTLAGLALKSSSTTVAAPISETGIARAGRWRAPAGRRWARVVAIDSPFWLGLRLAIRVFARRFTQL